MNDNECRESLDKYIEVPSLNPEEVKLLSMIKKVELKQILFRPGSWDQYPKLSKQIQIYRNLLTILEQHWNLLIV